MKEHIKEWKAHDARCSFQKPRDLIKCSHQQSSKEKHMDNSMLENRQSEELNGLAAYEAELEYQLSFHK